MDKPASEGAGKPRRKSADILEELQKKKKDRWADWEAKDEAKDTAEAKPEGEKVKSSLPTRVPIQRVAWLAALTPPSPHAVTP